MECRTKKSLFHWTPLSSDFFLVLALAWVFVLNLKSSVWLYCNMCWSDTLQRSIHNIYHVSITILHHHPPPRIQIHFGCIRIHNSSPYTTRYTLHNAYVRVRTQHTQHTQHTHCNIPALDIFNRAGIKKAKVFPDPVIAMPITSLPDSRGGQHWAWGRKEEKMWGGDERRGEVKGGEEKWGEVKWGR
jgi:hypothetical protein